MIYIKDFKIIYELINCIYYYKYLAVKLSNMYRIPLDDYNSNFDTKLNTC